MEPGTELECGLCPRTPLAKAGMLVRGVMTLL